MTWIRTRYGHRVDLWRPNPGAIDVRDIAHALARLCRFTGHVACDLYSVGQHSVLVSEHVPEDLALHALVHDAAESYVADVSRPLREAMRMIGGDSHAEIADGIDAAIRSRFSLRLLNTVERDTIKQADLAALRTEWRDVMRADDGDVAWCPEPWPERIDPWSVHESEEQFLARWHALKDGRIGM